MTAGAPEPRQLALDLPHDAASGAGDFMIGASNRAAAELVESWPTWPHPAALIAGPPASGKSHLAAVFAARSGAPVVPAGTLTEETVVLFSRPDVVALVVEDIDRGIASDRILFHLLNHARETGRHLLLTSATPPGEMDVALPDLRSRLRALPVIAIAEPDDALLSAVLVKLFADRQLAIEPAVLSHMLRHMDRSFAVARAVVARIDMLALEEQRRVTRPLVGRVLSEFGSSDEPV